MSTTQHGEVQEIRTSYEDPLSLANYFFRVFG